MGGFYSAEDADSLPCASSERKREGAFCVWKHEEICCLLPDPIAEGKEEKLADLFNFHFSVMERGNLDPYQVIVYALINCSIGCSIRVVLDQGSGPRSAKFDSNSVTKFSRTSKSKFKFVPM